MEPLKACSNDGRYAKVRHALVLVETHLALTEQFAAMRIPQLARDLLEEARQSNQRRLLVLSGPRDHTWEVVHQLLDELPIGISDTIAVSEAGTSFVGERLDPDRSEAIMGRTVTLAILDLQDGTRPNTIGRVTGAVDGGGLLIMLTPPFATWAAQRDGFDRGLVVEPHNLADVRGGFKRRLIDTLRTSPGVTVVDVSSGTVQKTPVKATAPKPVSRPTSDPIDTHSIPAEFFAACRTRDQQLVLEAFGELDEPPVAVVVSAERGRGKSSAAGLAAAAFVKSGRRVLVTAPRPEHVQAFFVRAHAHCPTIPAEPSEPGRPIQAGGGQLTFAFPIEAVEAVESGSVDIVFVDEAAGVPVHILEALLACDRIVFTTTRHGYEGTGHGFAIRFRERLADAPHTVVERQMVEPIRYARHDPIEGWLTRALILDARPPVDAVIPSDPLGRSVYRRYEQSELEKNHNLLRELLGLLSLAHYRTEPDDLARILDAPNLTTVALETAGHPVAVALLATEGGLDPDTVERAYRGERLRGNLIPDMLLSTLRDAETPLHPGLRIVRIATHPAVQRCGLGTRLLEEIRNDWDQDIDWIATGFGATPGLLDFWQSNEFRPFSLSARRNPSSGAHSAMLVDCSRPLAGCFDRWIETFPDRFGGSLSDLHRSVDPPVAQALLAAAAPTCHPALEADEWRRLVASANGPGRYDLDPIPARQLVLAGLTAEPAVEISDRRAQVLIAKILQGQSWDDVANQFEYEAAAGAKRALGTALGTLLDKFGTKVVEDERDRLGSGMASEDSNLP